MVVGLVDIDLTDAVEAELRLTVFGDMGGADVTDADADGDNVVDGDGDAGGIGRVLALSSVLRESSEFDRDMKLDSTVDDLLGTGIEG
jgi:hypothetical protein